jgi:hypothetical protein
VLSQPLEQCTLYFLSLASSEAEPTLENKSERFKKCELTMKYKDFTIKARLTNRCETEQLIKDLKARFVGVDIQIDQYFKVSLGKLKYREGSIENLITHYEKAGKSGSGENQCIQV